MNTLPSFYLAQKFVTTVPRASHWSLSWIRPQSQPISLQAILFPSPHLCLALSWASVVSGFQPSVRMHFSPATCPFHHILLDLNILILQPIHALCWSYNIEHRKKLHGLSPQANYTDRATAACRRSDCQLLRIQCATWSAWRIPTAVFSVF
jgi:hypothetical protein